MKDDARGCSHSEAIGDVRRLDLAERFDAVPADWAPLSSGASPVTGTRVASRRRRPILLVQDSRQCGRPGRLLRLTSDRWQGQLSPRTIGESDRMICMIAKRLTRRGASSRILNVAAMLDGSGGPITAVRLNRMGILSHMFKQSTEIGTFGQLGVDTQHGLNAAKTIGTCPDEMASHKTELR